MADTWDTHPPENHFPPELAARLRDLRASTGTPGAAGPKGDKGDRGDVGPKGDQGAPGVNGTNGSAGAKGDRGDVGPKGDKGDPGTNGAAGAKGDPGTNGAAGPGNVLDVTGARLAVGAVTLGQFPSRGAGNTLVGRDLSLFQTEQRVFGGSARLARVAGSIAGSSASGVAYWIYIGQLARDVDLTTNNVALMCTTVGAGTQVAEVALASTPSAPKKASQVLTRLASSASLLTLTSGTGLKKATGPLNFTGAPITGLAGTHCWIGCRFVMGTTQPIFWSLAGDRMNGEILTTAAATITGLGVTLDTFTTLTGSLITAAVTAQAPDLQFTLD